MRKKLYSFVLLAAGLLCSTSMWAYTGTGTEIDPYIVDNATDLKTLVKDYGGYIKLLNNIDDIGNAYLSIAKAVTLDLNGKRLINQTLASNSLISITASGKVVIKNGTLIKASGFKASAGKVYDGSNPCLKISNALAEVSLEGLTIGSSDQTTGDNRHLHYGINLKTVKSLKISEDVYFNGAKSSGSDIMIGNAATTEVIIGEIYNESKATILINATSAAKYESGYRPICIKKVSKNNGEIYAKFQSKIDQIFNIGYFEAVYDLYENIKKQIKKNVGFNKHDTLDFASGLIHIFGDGTTIRESVFDNEYEYASKVIDGTITSY